MVVIAIFRVIKAPFIDGNLSIIDCYAEAVHVFRNFVHVIKNRLVGAPVHVIEKTVHVHENCCSRVLRILTSEGPEHLRTLHAPLFIYEPSRATSNASFPHSVLRRCRRGAHDPERETPDVRAQPPAMKKRKTIGPRGLFRAKSRAEDGRWRVKNASNKCKRARTI